MSQDDLRGYYRLLRDAMRTFRQQGEKRLLVSVALHANMFLPAKLYQYVDRVNLMAYDLQSQSSNRRYHAELNTVQLVATSFVDSGCPPAKLILGIPLYARHRNNPGDVKTISEIVDLAQSSEVLKQSSSFQGYEFESREDMASKLEFVSRHGLGGVFYWEIGQDKQDPNDGPGGVFMTSTFRAVNSMKSDTPKLRDEL